MISTRRTWHIGSSANIPPKQTRKMIMRPFALLGKILGEIRRQMRVHPDEELLNYKQLDMLETVSKGISSAEEPLQEW